MTKDNSSKINVPITHFNGELLPRWDLYAHKFQGLTISKELVVHLCGKHSFFTKSLDYTNELPMNIHLNFEHYLCLNIALNFVFVLFLPHFLLSVFRRFKHSLESRFTTKKKSTLVSFFYTRSILKKWLNHLAFSTNSNYDLRYQSWTLFMIARR